MGAPRSSAAGRTLAELGLRTRFGVTALALWRGGKVVRTDVGRTPLQTGDGLLVVNLPERLASLARGGAFLVTGSKTDAPERPQRAVVAVTIFAAVLGVALGGLLPTAEAILAGAVAMVLTGCLSMEQAYRAVEWHVVFLVAGLLPLGFAMTESGLAGRLGALLGAAAATHSPVLAVALMFALTVAVTQVIGGQVSALLVAPVALAVAAAAGVAPQAMGVAVAIAASTAFMTPMAHPVNALMTGTGGYRPRDFVRVGAGLTVVTFAALMAAMWLFWDIG